MSARLPVVSGREAVKALGKAGFDQVSQRGSHVKLRHGNGVHRSPIGPRRSPTQVQYRPLHDLLVRAPIPSMAKARWLGHHGLLELPPEDKPDVIHVGPVGPIPIIDEDDPRFEEERAAWSAATAKAQALHTAAELRSGMGDSNWRVRHECIDRLLARHKDDPRTEDALLTAAAEDPAWQVRDAAMMRLGEFDPERVRPVLLSGLEDLHEDVRWSAQHVLEQLGLAP